MAEYRVEELAEAAGVSVETLRSYQSKGLLAPPRHEGRLALYDAHHLERLRAISTLKAQGHSLRVIARMLDPVGALAPVVPPGEDLEEPLSLREVAERTRVPPSMLRSLEASGVLRPRRFGDEWGYTSADVRAVQMLLSLVGGGLPLEEFLRVARIQLAAVDVVAAEAVNLFLQYVRDPLRASGLKESVEADQLATAFRLMLHATTELLAYNFQRAVLAVAQDEIEAKGTKAERAALRRESRRRDLEVVMPG